MSLVIISCLLALNQNQVVRAVKRFVNRKTTLSDISNVICQGSTTPTQTPTATSTPTPNQNCNAVWLQCGGIGFSGLTCCNTGNVCQVMNPWYSQCIPGVSATPTPTITPTPTATPTLGGSIPISSGTTATLTYFIDGTTQCFGSAIPSGNGCAVNPLLLGYTENQWTTLYKNASPNSIPWCGKSLTLTVNGASWTCTIIDTCDPVGNPFNSNGQIVGQKCNYENVIDLYGQAGTNFLLQNVGDDFFQGNVQWSIQ